MTGGLLESGMYTMCNKAVVPQLRVDPDICLEGLKNSM